MCDEYYDERMRKLWRVIADDEELEEEREEVEKPLLLQPIEPAKSKPKSMLR